MISRNDEHGRRCGRTGAGTVLGAVRLIVPRDGNPPRVETIGNDRDPNRAAAIARVNGLLRARHAERMRVAERIRETQVDIARVVACFSGHVRP